MESPGVGITFAVQWKKKPGVVNNREDVTSIGLWDSTLSWQTFKSYVSQNMGTSEGITISYVDSDGDEIPIDSECEFQEAMKFAKRRSVQGRDTRLNVERLETNPVPGNEQHCSSGANKLHLDNKLENALNVMAPTSSEENKKPKNASCGGQISSGSSVDKGHTPVSIHKGERGHRKGNSADKREIGKPSGQMEPRSSAESKPEIDKMSDEMETGPIKSRVEKTKQIGDLLKGSMERKCEMENVLDQMNAISKVSCQLENVHLDSSEAPAWFDRYMHKMKSEIIAEVTANVMNGIKQALAGEGEFSPSVLGGKIKNKKKFSDEDSSDGALGYDSSRDHKLLKKIEKLHKREKKLEKKLDSKLEKLESKTKRMMEKRSHSKARCERSIDKSVYHGHKRKSSDFHVNTYLMDAILLDDGPACEVYVHRGENFTKEWAIMNAGTIPWTDKTELRLAWGTTGLEPEETVVKCPILMPGEDGTVGVKFKPLELYGTFKSYWHFYHMGDRFGHWIGCTVVVIQGTNPGKEQPLFLDTVQERNVLTLTVDTEPESDGNECENIQRISLEIEGAGSECDSDIESDHLSIASAHGTLSSDTDDDNFVVIHMPSCFVCDAPAGEMDTIPVVVKNDAKKQKLTASEIKIINTEDTVNINENDFEYGVEHDAALAINQKIKSEYEDKPLSRIYAVDHNGHCISVNESHASFKSTSSFASGMKEELNSNPAGSPKKEPGRKEKKATDAKSDTSFSGNGEKSYYHSEFHHSSSSNSATGEGSSTQNGSKPAGFLIPHDPLSNVIHILPETLVSSAVNAATSAYNTACTVISNLRTPQGTDGSDGPWRNFPQHHSSLDSATTQNLNRLTEMGFMNSAINVLLLQRYNNDLLQVVGELLLSYPNQPRG